MEAKRGDILRILGAHVGRRSRRVMVREVRGADGSPPYIVRWLDDGHESVFYPGPDCTLESSRDDVESSDPARVRVRSGSPHPAQ